MTPVNILAEMKSDFKKAKFVAGLLVSFIDFFRKLDTPNGKFKNFDAFLKKFPQRETTAAGLGANQLIVLRPDGTTLGIRPFYNEAETFFRAEHKRFDYPSAPGHATASWQTYRRWLDALVTFSEAELLSLKAETNQFVLDTLKSQAFDPASVRHDPPLFKIILESFDLTTSGAGEPTGAAFQGLVFGFLRADNPHLQFEISNVRTGSKRLNRVGDIDGWDGERLALSAEVKQMKFGAGHLADIANFANECGRRGALGLVCALDYETDVAAAVEALGLRSITRPAMARIVELWDPLKQRTAVSNFVYYARHVEKKSALFDRLTKFLKEKEAEFHSEKQLLLSPGVTKAGAKK